MPVHIPYGTVRYSTVQYNALYGGGDCLYLGGGRWVGPLGAFSLGGFSLGEF